MRHISPSQQIFPVLLLLSSLTLDSSFHVYTFVQNLESILISLHSPTLVTLLVLSNSVQSSILSLSQLLSSQNDWFL